MRTVPTISDWFVIFVSAGFPGETNNISQHKSVKFVNLHLRSFPHVSRFVDGANLIGVVGVGEFNGSTANNHKGEYIIRISRVALV